MTGVKTIIYYILHVFSKARIFVLSIGLLLVGVLDLVGLSLFIPIIDLIQDKATSHHFITQYFISLFGFFDVPTDARFFLLLLCVVFLVKTTILMWTRYISVEMSANLQHFFRMRLLEGYLYASLEFMYSQKQGVLLSVLSDHTTRAASSFFILIQLILSSFTAVIYLIFIGLVSWELTLAALTGGIVIFPIVRKIGKLSHQYASKNNEFLEISQHSVLESLQAKKMISAMDLIKERIELYNPISIEVRDSWKWVAFWSNSPGIIIQPIAVIILSFLVILSIYSLLCYHLFKIFSHKLHVYFIHYLCICS